AGLLARSAGSAALRPTAPDTRTASPMRGVRGAVLRYGLTAAAGALAALIAALPFIGPGRGQSTDPRGGGLTGTPPVQTGGTDEPEGARLTFGPNGPPRP